MSGHIVQAGARGEAGMICEQEGDDACWLGGRRDTVADAGRAGRDGEPTREPGRQKWSGSRTFPLTESANDWAIAGFEATLWLLFNKCHKPLEEAGDNVTQLTIFLKK